MDILNTWICTLMYVWLNLNVYQPCYIMCMISCGFVRQSKRALTCKNVPSTLPCIIKCEMARILSHMTRTTFQLIDFDACGENVSCYWAKLWVWLISCNTSRTWPQTRHTRRLAVSWARRLPSPLMPSALQGLPFLLPTLTLCYKENLATPVSPV